LRDSLKLASRKILIKDWIKNNLYGVEFENFTKLFNGRSYDPKITERSEKEVLDSVVELIPMLSETYATQTSEGIPLPEKKLKVLYDDLRAPILSKITNKHQFVFAEYSGNGTKIYFKEDLGNTIESATNKLVNPDTTNGLVTVYGLMSKLHKIDVLNVNIDNNGAIRAGKLASDASPYVAL
ncbi:MAG: hypothetical protein GOU98_03255, partial [Candidatus Altiarchaeota archaeon]|nr:hypothetical protein [Candidatus Altiarchaeota archaeon]